MNKQIADDPLVNFDLAENISDDEIIQDLRLAKGPEKIADAWDACIISQVLRGAFANPKPLRGVINETTN